MKVISARMFLWMDDLDNVREVDMYLGAGYHFYPDHSSSGAPSKDKEPFLRHRGYLSGELSRNLHLRDVHFNNLFDLDFTAFLRNSENQISVCSSSSGLADLLCLRLCNNVHSNLNPSLCWQNNLAKCDCLGHSDRSPRSPGDLVAFHSARVLSTASDQRKNQQQAQKRISGSFEKYLR